MHSAGSKVSRFEASIEQSNQRRPINTPDCVPSVVLSECSTECSTPAGVKGGGGGTATLIMREGWRTTLSGRILVGKYLRRASRPPVVGDHQENVGRWACTSKGTAVWRIRALRAGRLYMYIRHAFTSIACRLRLIADGHTDIMLLDERVGSCRGSPLMWSP